jgi:histone acetyltransferase 1
MVKRIQILVSFYIEGGTPIELEDADWSLERWTVFFLYEKKTIDVPEGTSPYIFMGYSTVYRYYYYQPLPSSSPPSAKKQRVSHPANLDFKRPISNPDDYAFSSLPCRTRISQFIILPPFQGTGSGSRLYNTIFAHYLALPQTIEITVEDPNEAFDDLRDLNDLTLLRTVPAFLSIKINTTVTPRPKGPAPNDIVDSEKLEEIRKSMKIAPRQFYRVVEMHLLSLIPASVRQSLIHTPETSSKAGVEDLKVRDKEYKLWLLWVKKRLYRHNKIMLAQLDRAERIEKLEQAVGGVEADYARLLRALEGRGKGKGKELEVGEASSSGNGIGKRGTPMDGVEVEDEDEPAAKKVKFAS